MAKIRQIWKYYLEHSFIIKVFFVTAFIFTLINLTYPDSGLYKYQCYIHQFWHPEATIGQNNNICRMYISTWGTDANIHLPSEYPLLSLIPFSLPLLIPSPLYLIPFSIEMSLIVTGFCAFLKKQKGKAVALLFLQFVFLGNLFSSSNKFDFIPSFLTLFCLVAAIKKRFIYAYLLLATAVLFKYYPIILLLPLFIYEQVNIKTKIFSKRLYGITIFSVLISLVTALSFAINFQDTLSPFHYFTDRPIQIESVQATSAIIYAWVNHLVICQNFTFGSDNILISQSDCSTPILTITKLISMIYFVIFILIYVGILYKLLREKISLEKSFLAILLLSLATGKIFSPQYLLWITPFIVYIYGFNRFWIISWGILSLLTTIYYPLLYQIVITDQRIAYYPLLYLIIGVRNCLLIGILYILLTQSKKIFNRRIST